MKSRDPGGLFQLVDSTCRAPVPKDTDLRDIIHKHENDVVYKPGRFDSKERIIHKHENDVVYKPGRFDSKVGRMGFGSGVR
jgi:hypothetical protein